MVKVRYVSDKEMVATIKQSLAENDGYCPCRLSKTADTKCMCKEFRDIISSSKIEVCHCGLYETYDPDELSQFEKQLIRECRADGMSDDEIQQWMQEI